MFIIFGISRKVARMATVFALCAFCHTPAAQVVTRVRSHFSLFFIPIIPMGTQYRATCTLCGTTSEISAEEAEQAVRAATLHQAAVQAPAAPSAPGWAPPAPPPFQAPAGQPPTLPPAPGAGPQPG